MSETRIPEQILSRRNFLGLLISLGLAPFAQFLNQFPAKAQEQLNSEKITPQNIIDFLRNLNIPVPFEALDSSGIKEGELFVVINVNIMENQYHYYTAGEIEEILTGEYGNRFDIRVSLDAETRTFYFRPKR
jgi:hypothetical protein